MSTCSDQSFFYRQVNNFLLIFRIINRVTLRSHDHLHIFQFQCIDCLFYSLIGK